MQGELKPGSIKISRLRTKVLEGEIKIPPFQREFVWDAEQVIELLDSIYKDFPIGSVLLWETNDRLPSQRDIGGFSLPETDPELPLLYVLDGQQRITTIFGVFRYEAMECSDDEMASKFNIAFDMVTKEFRLIDEVTENDLTIPLSLLFDNYRFNQYLTQNSRFDEALSKEASELQAVFQNYELPMVTIKKRTKDEVGIIFERINNTGTPLSTLELLTAWTWKEEYHLREIFDNIYDLLESCNFGNLKEKLLLQCFSAVIEQSTKTTAILNLDPEKVRQKTPLVVDSIKKTIDLLSTEFNVKTDEFLPKPQQFVVLVYLYSQARRVTSQQLNTMKQWFWRTTFSNRYSAGTDEKMNEDIDFVNSLLKNDFLGLTRYKSELTASIFSKKTLTKSNFWSRGFLLLRPARGQKILLMVPT